MTGDLPGVLARGPRRATLLLWVAVVALMHFDRGAASVAAMDLGAWDGRTVKVSAGYVVALLVGHSLGLASGSLLAGMAFQSISAKIVLALGFLMHAAALLAFSFQSQSFEWGAAAGLRFASGFAASPALVFLPLWVDEYAPSDAQPQWMALIQMGAPIGQFLGTAVAGLLTVFARSSNGQDWRTAFFVQAVAFVPIVLLVVFIPSQQVDVRNISSLRTRMDSLTLYPQDGSHMGHFQGMLRETREMLQGISRNPLNVSLTTTLCFLHSTCAGLALWAAPYLALSTDSPPAIAALLIAAATLTLAPMLGTYCGAVLCDRMEGFKAGNHASALRCGCCFLALAALAGPLSSGVESFAPRLALLWMWLFCAGAFMPISAGVLMTSMPSYLRSFAAASSSLAINLVSYTLVPIISGALVGCFNRQQEGLTFGICTALWTTVPAAVLLLLAYAREPKANRQLGGHTAPDDLTFSEISYELSRRRLSTAPL